MSKNNYGFGYISIPWHKKHQNLKYVHEPFNDEEQVKKWITQGYDHKRFTGEMYDMRKPKPEWFDLNHFKKMFRWEKLSWSFYRMRTNTILPEHIDTFKRYKQLYPDYDHNKIYRAVIFLEDWKPGHLLTIADKQFPQWKAGDYVWWRHDIPHLAANVGLADRYTLQLTGFNYENQIMQ